MKRSYGWMVLLLALVACKGEEPAQPEPQPGWVCAEPPAKSTRLCMGPGALPESYVGKSFQATFEASGGTGARSWELVSGRLPEGLSLSSEGTLSGTLAAAGTFPFTLRVTDGAQHVDRELTLVVHEALVVPAGALPGAIEGIRWFAAPELPVRVAARGGKPPLTYAAEGLPAGLSLAADSGVLSGTPAQGSAGTHAVTVRVTDAAGLSVSRALSIDVRPARPIPGGGVAGRAPHGGPLTDTLTVFVLGEERQPLAGVGVRVRKNGAEYAPPRQALTDAQGRVLFTGLDLNGTTDTVDITANGPGLTNETLVGVNAALVTLGMVSYPLPRRHYGAVSAYDTDAQRLLVTGGFHSLSVSACANDVLELSDAATNRWHEALPPAMLGAMPARRDAAAAYASGVMVVFGGSDCLDPVGQTYPADTWEYAPATRTWTRTAATGPAPRSAPVMTPDGSGERVLLFGGQGANFARFADLWVYTPATDTWEQRTPSGTAPGVRSEAAAAFDSRQGEMVVCGGRASGDLADCHAYSVAGNSWRALPAMPVPRSNFGMAFHPDTGELYVFGGSSGTAGRNDLLVLRDGAWVTLTPDGAANAPVRRDGFVFELDRKGGRLVLVGGRSREGEGALGDVWTYTLATGQWTQSGGPRPSGPRLSGAITSATPLPSFAFVYVVAVGNAGFSFTRVVTLTNGTASYTMRGIQPGETLAVHAYVLDGDPQSVIASVDLGTVGPLTQDTTLNITFPAQPRPVNTFTATLTAPSDWTSVSFVYGAQYEKLPGLPLRRNGGAEGNEAERSVRFSSLPLTSGGVQRYSAGMSHSTPELCEVSTIYWEGDKPGPFALPPGPRGVAPGLSECASGTPPDVTEEVFTFTLPAGAALWRMWLGSYFMLDDWRFSGPGRAQPVAFRLPEPSTLAPSRVMPPGQHVSWVLNAGLFGAGSFRADDFSWSAVAPEAWAGTQYYGYVRR